MACVALYSLFHVSGTFESIICKNYHRLKLFLFDLSRSFIYVGNLTVYKVNSVPHDTSIDKFIPKHICFKQIYRNIHYFIKCLIFKLKFD